MKVLHVAQPVSGGVAAVVADLARDQRERGWEPVVACPREGRLRSQITGLGVPVADWEATRGPGPGTAREVASLRRIIAERRPDVVHLHGSKAGLAGRLAVRGRIPTVFQPHLWSFESDASLAGRLAVVWERAAARWTGLFLCVSADEARDGAGSGIRGRMVVVPNGVDVTGLVPVDIARAKAERFAGWSVVDLCCGIGGDSCALAASCPDVWAVDVDPGMVRRTRWNADVYEVGGRLQPIQADAKRIEVPSDRLVQIDPDRRAGRGTRARSVHDYEPGLPFLLDLMGRTRGGAVKVGPASDFAEHFQREEIELVGLHGECKEATIWFGELATCRRRATCWPEGATWTDRDGPIDARLPVVGPAAWVFDPDATLLRAGLLGSFASAHGLGRLMGGVDYLSGTTRVDSPFLAAFEVLEVLPLDLKKLARLVRERRLGPLEIKVRGLDLRPEDIRARLRPPGPGPATLLLAGGSGPAKALLVQRPPQSIR